MMFPWEIETQTLEERFAALQRDIQTMVTHTGIKVRSNMPDLCMTYNTPRGQVIPLGEAQIGKYITVELQDIGMPQPGCLFVNSITEIAQTLIDLARELEQT